jgi:Zn-dependent M16 (insulinase) family peptidase
MKGLIYGGFVVSAMVFMSAGTIMAEDFYESLKQGRAIHGFAVESQYLNGRDEAFGARFLHKKTGFTLDLFEIQSVPQGFFWVNTPPESDMGESHTCEHLLLGKGNKGRYVASLEDMSLGKSTAYTSQIYTAYPFSSGGGNEIFFDLLEAKLDALVHPNFSDEEIRREVCHLGVIQDAEAGNLQLEEKGTVYTEMVSSFERHWYYLYGEMDNMLYGDNHPLSYVSGGIPAAIRKMKPSDLRGFHKKRYQLNNMGIIVTVPDNMPASGFLERINAVLLKIDGGGYHPDIPRAAVEIPPSNSRIGPGEIRVVTYPGASEEEPGHLVFAWPPTLEYDNKERMLLEVFLICLGGSQTSNLYDRLINSDTRVADLGANRVWAYVDDNPGHAVFIGISNVEPGHINENELAMLSRIICDEAAAIASYGRGSPELEEFNNRARSHLVQMRKSAEEYLNSPPGFGLRGGSGGGWYALLRLLEKKKGFRKSLLQKEELEYVEAELVSDENIWAPLIDKWNLIKVKPYAIGCKADPSMLAKAVADKERRLELALIGLKEKYGVTNDADAIGRYKEEYDRNTALIKKEAAMIPMPKFLENPPLSYDPQLNWRVDTLGDVVPLVASAFNSMTSATVGLALKANVIPEDRLIYLPILPQLVTQIGVIKDGEVIDYATMNQRLQNEILDLDSYITSNPHTGRVELMVTGAGSDPDESRLALEWMSAGLFNPYLENDNLPRIRDVVDNRLTGLRNRMKQSEEAWVHDPANGYLYQNNRLLLAGSCFFTQAHFMHRLEWRLKEAGGDQAERETGELFDLLAAAGRGLAKDKLADFAAGFTEGDPARFESGPFAHFVEAYTIASGEAQDIIAEALSDLAAIMPDIPEENVSGDWIYLAGQMKDDLLFRPAKVLEDLEETMALLRHRENARMFIVSNEEDRLNLMPAVAELVSGLDTASRAAIKIYSDHPVILERMRSRYAGLEKPTYVGLVNRDTRNGVFIFTADCAGINETDEEKLLDFLADRMYGGGGAHSMFMKTWSAGLAYSNGLRADETGGRIIYYAERCPDLAATMRFVVNELENAPYDSTLVEYAVAQAFYINRGSNSYVSRGMAIANDLADGTTPEKVGRFRGAILILREKENLYDILRERMERVYGRVLIGYGSRLSEYSDGSYFIIGPEVQLNNLEEYIAAVEEEQPVYRIFSRDFWITQ